ncbi:MULTISPECIES: DUF7521 family protein [Halorussus]|uniref:DUF7521 family protein n=1 Tax=Halorussus TaxID=1070314 RepID=UPI00209F2974|nr:hypothetical protein [Halorussus vallis]USZ74231.1 hypothetical protein NGM07_12330 [Halorussus vallis]
MSELAPLPLGVVPLQTATGGSALVVALALVGLLLTAVLALAVAYRMVRGYRRHRDRARLAMAVGVILLTAGPILVQLVLTNFTDASTAARSAVANASKLLGLCAMLYAIYGVTGRRETATVRVERDIGGDVDTDDSEEVGE